MLSNIRPVNKVLLVTFSFLFCFLHFFFFIYLRILGKEGGEGGNSVAPGAVNMDKIHTIDRSGTVGFGPPTLVVSTEKSRSCRVIHTGEFTSDSLSNRLRCSGDDAHKPILSR